MHHSDRLRFISITIRSTGLAAALLATCYLIGPAAADDAFVIAKAPGFDTSTLVRYQGKRFKVQHEGWVATDPLTTTRVKKIEAGRVSYVTITTTATGTYSTDGMFSKHVQYPGISVSEAPRLPRNHFAYWSDDHWSGFTSTALNSFSYVSAGSTHVLQTNGQTCVVGKSFSMC